MSMSVSVGVYKMCAGIHGGQKKALGPLELESEAVLSYCVINGRVVYTVWIDNGHSN